MAVLGALGCQVAASIPHPLFRQHAPPAPRRRSHLLQLPRNAAAHRALEDRGAHPAFAALPRQLLAADGGTGKAGAVLEQRLRRTLSQLAHYCPLFGEIETGGFGTRALTAPTHGHPTYCDLPNTPTHTCTRHLSASSRSRDRRRAARRAAPRARLWRRRARRVRGGRDAARARLVRRLVRGVPGAAGRRAAARAGACTRR